MKEPSNSQPKPQSYDYLSKAQQKSEGVASQWDQDNQQWWNWYMTLAENEHDQTNAAAKPAIAGVQAPIEIDESTLAKIASGLSAPYKLSSACISQFAKDGYIKLKNVIDPEHLTLLRQRINSILIDTLGVEPELAFR
ncbi:MAG TPA: hypothetical protein DCG06_12835, partial [Deltaproteobacteria bacterium]|nr:hypothetical protein [Deltaproteobacteria bacterium]